MADFVDIIIPAYNAHDTIRQTLFSILMQTYHANAKVYIIDDCSKKTYDYLIDEFKDKLDITVLRNEKNSGPGFCRNTGLAISSSKYVMFLDADDYLYDSFALECLFCCIGDGDFVVGSAAFENEDGTLTFYDNHESCLHGKMYSRVLITSYNISFPSNYRHEDNAFHKLCILCSNNIKLISRVVYFYSYNHKSLTHLLSGFDEFKNYKYLIDNMLWVIKNAKKRKVKDSHIMRVITPVLLYLYFEYQRFYHESYSFVFFEWLKPLIAYFNKNKLCISDDFFGDEYNLMASNYFTVPLISWYDFCAKSLDFDAGLKLKIKSKDTNGVISIIVPVYNSEKTLSKTLDSIINQSYSNLEIILIDDCSTDNSASICKFYKNKDNRIKYYQNKINMGVSKTRNFGLSVATGDFIGFVDSDDTIKKSMYMKLYKQIISEKADFVQCSDTVLHQTKLFGLKKLVLSCNKDVVEKSFKWDFISCMIWDKLFTRDIIGDTRFEEDWSKSEDAYFVAQIISKTSRAVLIPDVLYNYYVNSSNSLSKKCDFSKEIKYCVIYDYMENLVRKNYTELLMPFYLYKIAGLSCFVFNNLCYKNIISLNDNENDKISFLNDTYDDVIYFINHANEYVSDFYYKFMFNLLNELVVYCSRNLSFYINNQNKNMFLFLGDYINRVLNLYKKVKKKYKDIFNYYKTELVDSNWCLDDFLKMY